MRFRPGWVASAALAALALASCQDVPTSGPARLPLFVINDAAHDGTNEHFYFLPPMVPAPSYEGTFDGGLGPTVEICELAGNACTPVLATFDMTTGPGGETVRVVPQDEHYIVNWHTDAFALDAAKTYRIRVLVEGTELGFADVDVVSSGNELRNVNSGASIPLLDGRTLPIKFRIEEGAYTGPDLEGPVLVGLTFAPTEVDVADGSAQVTVSLTITDVGTGTEQVIVQVDGPGGQQTATCIAGVTSGDKWSGVWVCMFTIPQGSEPGAWHAGVSLSDVVSNVTILGASALQAAGLPTGFTVTNASADLEAPVLAGLTFTPAEVDVTGEDGHVTVSLTVTDVGTGAEQVMVQVDGPGGQHTAMCTAGVTSGDRWSGVWTCDLTIPQGSEPGAWHAGVSLSDGVSNVTILGASALQAAGLPSGFTVIDANPDLEAPVLAGLAFTPAEVDVTGGDGHVTVSLTVTDVGTGAQQVMVQVDGPGGQQTAMCTAGVTSGDRWSGEWTCVLTIPQGSEPGQWHAGVSLSDGVSNVTILGPSALQAAGLPTGFTVIG